MGFLSSISAIAGPIASALGSPAAGAVISGLGSYLNYRGASNANSAASASTAQQMAFQERMRDTSHQAEVKDLRAAGLNPVLSAGGSGASVPGGSSFTPVNELSSASDAAMRAAQLRLTNAQTAATAASTGKTVQDTRLSSAEADKAEILKAPYAALQGALPSIKSSAKDAASFFTSDRPYSPKWAYDNAVADIKNLLSSSGPSRGSSAVDMSNLSMIPKLNARDLPALPTITVHPRRK